MKERPILFKAEMVNAILAGKKTQTRRIIKPQPDSRHGRNDFEPDVLKHSSQIAGCWHVGKTWVAGCWHVDKTWKCPYGKAGDQLWVRETWAALSWDWQEGWMDVQYGADGAVSGPLPVPDNHWLKIFNAAHKYSDAVGDKWRPSIHMPRWASRIQCKVVSVRVERLQDITDADALAEGIDRTNASIPGYARERFWRLWDSINDKRGFGWDTNPWVWVVELNKI